MKRIIYAVVLASCCLTLVGCGASKSSDAKKEDKQESKTPKEYKVGDTATYKGYEVKLNSVNFSQGNDMDKPKDGKQYVIMNVTITNKSDKKQSFNSLDFNLNTDGKSETMMELVIKEPVNQLGSGKLDKDASVTGDLIGQAPPTAKLKLEYKPSIFSDKSIDFLLN